MRYQIITEEALIGGWNHTLVDTAKAPTHKLYERGVQWSQHQSPPQSLLQLQRQLDSLGQQKVRAYQ